MGQNLQLDPATGDYVIVNGRPVEDDTLNTPAYIRLKAKRTKWLFAPDSTWGSDLYLFQKQHTPPDDQSLCAAAQRALQPLIDAGRAIMVSAVNTASYRNASALTVTLVQTSGEPTSLVFNPVTN